MRKKENRLVITFHSTTEAMAAEKRLKEANISGRLIPVPKQISAGCGLAWSAPEGEREAVVRSFGLMQLSFDQMTVVQI